MHIVIKEALFISVDMMIFNHVTNLVLITLSLSPQNPIMWYMYILTS